MLIKAVWVEYAQGLLRDTDAMTVTTVIQDSTAIRDFVRLKFKLVKLDVQLILTVLMELDVILLEMLQIAPVWIICHSQLIRQYLNVKKIKINSANLVYVLSLMELTIV